MTGYATSVHFRCVTAATWPTAIEKETKAKARSPTMKKRDKMATGDVAKQQKIEGVRSVADWDGGLV